MEQVISAPIWSCSGLQVPDAYPRAIYSRLVSNVEFNEPTYAVSRTGEMAHKSDLADLLVQKGITKDRPGAERVLLITVGVCIVIGILALILSQPKRPEPGPPVAYTAQSCAIL